MATEKTGDARAWEIIASAERFAVHDPRVEWPNGPHNNAVDAICAAFDAQNEPAPDSALMRAIQCARALRDFAVRGREDGDQPFTIPEVQLSTDDNTAEVEVSHSWGFSASDLELFVQLASEFRGELIVFKRQDEERVCASFRFTE